LCLSRQPQENHLIERSELFDLMGELQLYGMKAAFPADPDLRLPTCYGLAGRKGNGVAG